MRVHLDKGKSTVRLEARLGNVSKVLEEGDKVSLRGVGSQIANVARRLPLGRLGHNHVVALHTVGGEVVVAERSRWCHAHRGHGLLLRNRRLPLLVGPVAADGARTEPLSVHGVEGTLSISTIPESDESVAAGSARLHVPHDASLGHGAKRGESLQKHLVVDLVGQVAHKDVEVVRSVFLGCVVRLIRPVDTDFLLPPVRRLAPYTTAQQCLRCCGCGGH